MVRRRKEGYYRGAAAVELALVMPIMLLVSFGAIKYGWLYLKAQQITNAARYGARVASRAGSTTDEVLDAIDALLGPNPPGANISDPIPPTVIFRVNNEIVANLESVTIEVGDAITVAILVETSNTNVDIMDVPLFPPPRRYMWAFVTMAKEGF